MIFRKKKNNISVPVYDPDRYTPVLRCSICTGEQTAGFKENATGVFHEIMLIRNEQDLEEFRKTYKAENIKKEY